MLKKVDASQLRVGMFIHDLDCGWMEHPFVRSQFLLTCESEIQKIRDARIHGVVIDCGRGMDVDAPTLAQAQAATEAEVTALATTATSRVRVSVGEELQRAATVRREAVGVVRTVMQDARLGKAVHFEEVGPVVQNITESILRNAGALLGLLQIKNKDDYTFLHSVSVCTLLVAFCRSRNLDDERIYQAGIGGLLHDTGKALVPDAILHKAGRLTDAEFAIIKRHPRDGHDILLRTPGIGAIPLDITLHHHERRDGSGYPDAQAGSAISELAQMAAIVDVYDAITSERCYHRGCRRPKRCASCTSGASSTSTRRWSRRSCAASGSTRSARWCCWNRAVWVSWSRRMKRACSCPRSTCSFTPGSSVTSSPRQSICHGR